MNNILFMEKNMGNFDRILRSAIAIALIALNAKGLISGGVAAAAIIISVVFFLTGLFGFCPVYELFGINSRKTS
jgi:hypothetical protein